MKILLKDCICASFLFSIVSGFAAEFEDPLQDLRLVGEAQLRVFFGESMTAPFIQHQDPMKEWNLGLL